VKSVLIIPAYNEGAALGSVVSAALQLPAGCLDGIIVVDDGSTTKDRGVVPDDARVTLVRHAHNEGKARALIDGMQRALEQNPDFIITMDGDGQHRIQDIPSLLTTAQAKPHTIVVGARLAERASIPRARYRANRFANFWIAWASGYPVIDSQSGFRVYPSALLRSVLPRLVQRYPVGSSSRRKGFVFESEMLIESGRLEHGTTPVHVPAIYETSRSSHFRPVADITQIVIMVAGHLLRRGLYPLGLWRSLRRGREGELRMNAQAAGAAPTVPNERPSRQ
jgi:glycosyltransferase involved in cell wall biosynthesis